jgi:hypothetical protein
MSRHEAMNFCASSINAFLFPQSARESGGAGINHLCKGVDEYGGTPVQKYGHHKARTGPKELKEHDGRASVENAG